MIRNVANLQPLHKSSRQTMRISPQILTDIIVDTNVLVSALRSNQGAAFRLVSIIGQRRFNLHISVPVLLEYEDVLHRQLRELPGLNADDINRFLDYICSVAHQHEIFFLWRPTLRDPKDEMLLELAVEAQCDAIITYNRRDFVGSNQFGVQILSPREYLVPIGVIK
jgi:putative PIN family toxin of toxin-antitoxin system